MKSTGSSFRALRVAGIYAVLAFLWIVLSDRVASHILPDSEAHIAVQTVKGGLFVLLTAALLYVLLRRELGAQERAYRAQSETQQWLQAMADTTTDVIFVKDRQGRYLFVNRMQLSAVGKVESDVLGRDDRGLFNREEAAFIMETDQRIMSSGETMTVEEWVTHQSRGRRHLTATKGPLRDTDGSVIGLFGIVRDITPMKEVEEALRASEERFRQIADVTSDIVFVTDEEGRVTYISRAVTSLAGYEVAEVVGQPFTRMLAAEDAASITKIHRMMLADRASTRGLDVRIIRRDGTFFYGEINASFFESAGAPGMLGVIRDVTDRRRVEDVLKEGEAQLRALGDNLPGGMLYQVTQDPDGRPRYTYMSAGIERLLGMKAETALADAMVFWNTIHEADQERFMAAQLKCASERSLFDIEFRQWSATGELKWLHCRSTPRLLADGSTLWDGVAIDITERKQTEEAILRQARLQELLMNMSATFINLPLDAFAATVDRFLGDMASFVGVDRSYVFEYDADHATCSPTHAWCREGMTSQLDAFRDASRAGWAAPHFRGEPIHVPDVAAMASGALRDLLEPLGIRSFLSVPLLRQGSCIGFVGFDAVRQDHNFAGDEIGLLVVFAEMLVNVRERRHTDASLRWKETQLAASLDATADGILAVDDKGRIVKANARFAELWRIPEALLQRGDDGGMLAFVLDQLIDPEAFLARVRMLYGTDLVDKDTLLFKDGRVFERYSSPMRMDGQTVGRVWSFRDVTEQRRNEAKLRHLNEVLRAIRAINQVILRENEADRLLREACEILQGTRGYSAVSIEPGEALHEAHSPSGGTATKTLVLDEVSTEAAAETGPISVQSDGVASLAALPLRRHRRVVAMLKVRADRVRAFDADELSLLSTLANDLAHALQGIEDRRTRFEAEQKLRMEDAALAATSNGVLITDHEGRIVWTNAAVTRLTGYAPEELVGQNPRLLKSGRHDAEFYRNMWTTIRSGDVWQGEIINRRKDGRLCHEDMSITPIRGDDQTITHFVAINQDITERVHLQQQLVQSQKMETVGRLAGGVAHDFNNLLQAILGYVEMLLLATPSTDRRHADLLTIQKTGRRAAELTRQLLALGQKQNLNPRVTDINALIADLVEMLQRVLGEDVHLALDLAPKLEHVLVDQGQIGQILLNLAINARDAMPRGGRLVFQTAMRVYSAEDVVAQPEARPGVFVCLSVTDTGSGMPPEVLANLFQPFFTTKAPGKGTGLGLATSYGIARQHGGWMDAQSELGKGATFRLHLPVIDRQIEPDEVPAKTRPGTVPMQGRGQRILFVEDADAVRSMVKMLLEQSGYEVVAAADAAAALSAFNQQGGAFDLILTDVVLPDLNGLELLETLCAKRPQLRVLVCSGYTDNEKRWPIICERQWPFIGKPYTKDELLAALHDAFQAPGP